MAAEYDSAAEALLQAVRLKPDYAGAIYNLGVAYLMSGDKKAATEQYTILKPMNPGNANNLYLLIYKKPPPAH